MTIAFTSFDYVLICIVGGICLFSLITGFLKRISGTVALLCAFVGTYVLSKLYFTQLFTKSLYKALAFLILFIIIFILVRFILRKASDKMNHLPIIGLSNRLLGLLLGILQSTLLILGIALILKWLSLQTAQTSLIIRFVLDFIGM